MLIKSKFEGYFSDGTRLYLGGGGGGTPPPDPRLVEAQIRSIGIQDDAIQRIVKQAEEMAPLTKESMQFALDSSRTAFNQSQEDRTYAVERRDQLTGMQDQMISDAKDFNAGTKGAEMAAQGVADVENQTQAARKAILDEQARKNINPSSGAAQAMQGGMGLSSAAAKAGVMSKAREGARQEGYMLTGRAADALKGYPTMGQSTTGAAAQYGASGLGIVGQGQSTQMAGNIAAANGAGAIGSNATSMYGTQANAYNAGQGDDGTMQAIGTIAGAALMLSDSRLKRDVRKVADDRRGFGWYEFEYVWGGGRRVGVLAQEVQAIIPAAVCEVDGYLAVDYGLL
jgi:hypothetical protein